MSGLPKQLHWLERTTLAVVLITCARVWLGPADVSPVASAQVPDAGRQRFQQIEEQQKTNQLLSELKQMLREMRDATHKVQVVTSAQDQQR